MNIKLYLSVLLATGWKMTTNLQANPAKLRLWQVSFYLFSLTACLASHQPSFGGFIEKISLLNSIFEL